MWLSKEQEILDNIKININSKSFIYFRGDKYAKDFFYCLLLFLLTISFKFTNIAISIIKNIDIIMITIKDNAYLFETDSVDAVIDGLFIEPGISGLKIDYDASYKIMKIYGRYDESLLEFKKVLPDITITNTYNKYVKSGNKTKNNISLIFKVTSSKYLENILKILKEEDITVTFFVSDINNISMINSYNQDVELLSNTYSKLEINYFNRKNKSSFCYSDSINITILDNCSSERLHTIIPSINTGNNPYLEIKNNLENGVIIKLDNNYIVLKQLSYIINYIKQNNYNIVSLEKLLEE